MKNLRVSNALALPLDAVTQKFAWLGRTGSGKTFACKRMVEQMLRVRAQVVILDGAGVWAGLRLGKKSFDIPVLGGLYGDIPLESTAGALVADLIVDRGVSMVLDVSQMLDAERTRFATAFAQRFFQRKKAAPSAVHLVLEECQDFVPQNFQSGEERMLHEYQRIAKQGRAFGIGLSLISQRPQEISKKALNQTECVFAFQMTGPQERKALEHWLSDKGLEEKLSDVLPRLEVGAPHVWSPQWLKISKVVKILPIESLDTSSTPKVGVKALARKKLKPIDLKSLSAAMAETIERAKTDDPKELKKRIVELEKELGIAKLVQDRQARAAAAAVKEVPVPVDWRWLKKEFAAAYADFEKRVNNAMCDSEVNHDEKKLRADARKATSQFDLTPKRRKQLAAKAARVATAPLPQPTGGERDPAIGNSGLCRIMIALAQSPDGLSRRTLALRAGMSQSGTFSTYLSRARTSGWVYNEGDVIKITHVGTVALGHWDPLPTGDALFAYWLREVGEGSGAGRMLRVLHEAHPTALPRADLARRSGMGESGTFSTYLSRLRGLELVEGRSELKLSEELVG